MHCQAMKNYTQDLRFGYESRICYESKILHGNDKNGVDERPLPEENDVYNRQVYNSVKIRKGSQFSYTDETTPGLIQEEARI